MRPILFSAIILFSLPGKSQDTTKTATAPANTPQTSPDDTSTHTGGISVSPTKLYFTVKPGQNKSMFITVHNNYVKSYKMEVKFSDFEMTQNGKTPFQKGNTSKSSLAEWISFSPSFFEIPPGGEQKIAVTLNVPDIPEAYRAKWGTVFINQSMERQSIDASASDQTIAMGVIPTFSFGIYVYQNPPNVIVNKVEITNFSKTVSPKGKTMLELKAKNTGDGITFSTSYIELNNLKTGKKTKLGKKMFTILPDHERVFSYELPDKLEKGDYSVLGVLDFGSKTELEAAELQLKVE